MGQVHDQWMVDALGVAINRVEIIADAVGAPVGLSIANGPTAKKGAPSKPAKPAKKDPLDDKRGEIKAQLVSRGMIYLSEQYTRLNEAITKFKETQNGRIDALKPKQAPTGGGLFTVLAKGFNFVAKVAFPEVALIEAAGGAVVAVVSADKTMNDKFAAYEASKATKEVETLKKNAKAEITKLSDEVAAQVKASDTKLNDMLNSWADGLDKKILDGLAGMDLTHNIDDLLANSADIHRGDKIDPNIFANLTARLTKDFETWLEKDYKDRNFVDKADVVMRKYMWEHGNRQPNPGHDIMDIVKDNLDNKEFMDELNKSLEDDYNKIMEPS